MGTKHKPPSPIRVFGRVAHIRLQNGLVARVDTSDLPIVRQYHRWYAIRDGRMWYVIADRWDPVAKKQRLVALHRLLANAPPRTPVDHADHDGLNNRRSNLRVASWAGNARNQRKQEGCSSRFRGVHWLKRVGCWQARIMVNGARIYLGRFDREDDAGAAYRKAARKLHGAFACPDVARSS